MHLHVKIQEIERLLAERRLSQRAIARQLKVSRGLVAAVAHGRLAPHDRPTILGEEPPQPPARCPGCGGMVYLPCQLCHVREYAQRERVRQLSRRRLQVRGPGARSSAARRAIGAQDGATAARRASKGLAG